MSVEFISSIQQVPAVDWDSLWATNYPFVKHRFLALLEAAGCTTPKSGWQPQHAVLKVGQRVVAAMPVFHKTHSYGEYVFDWGWADAYQRNGLPYYPKLLNAIPFTPATGPRLGIATDCDAATAVAQLAAALDDQCRAEGYSGWHSLFPAAGQWQPLPVGLIERLGCQFQWLNRGYSHFDQFVADLNSRKRKSLLRERRKAAETGLTIDVVESAEVGQDDWRAFYQLYQNTYHKRSGRDGYLSEAFFTGLSAALPGQVYLARARSGEQLVAGALYFADSQTLYGRYWGALAELDSLHFECCYYQGIELAIRLGLQRFDAGAQGEHKIQRGFTPVLTHSYHHIIHPEFARAIGDFCREEGRQVQHYLQQARELLPFKEGIEVAEARLLLSP